MADMTWIPALAVPCGGSGGAGPPGKDGIDGKDGRDGADGKDGKDGAVYVPHIDEHNVLTFTIEETPAEIPPPIDLNPHDEWGVINQEDTPSRYVWENI